MNNKKKNQDLHSDTSGDAWSVGAQGSSPRWHPWGTAWQLQLWVWGQAAQPRALGGERHPLAPSSHLKAIAGWRLGRVLRCPAAPRMLQSQRGSELLLLADGKIKKGGKIKQISVRSTLQSGGGTPSCKQGPSRGRMPFRCYKQSKN